MLEHLLSVWPEVAGQLKNARRILLLSDFDGTLTPIVERPELANLPEETRLILQALAQERAVVVGLLSGRALTDLKDRVNISGIVYAGNHGLEIEGRGISFVNPVADELRPILRVMHHILSRNLETIKGVFVENKGLSLSVHYRLADERRVKEVEKIVTDVVGGTEAAGRAKVTSGKKVYEVRPAAAWDKGKAIDLLTKRLGKGVRKSEILPIYIGDDLTDEDGFRAITDYGTGITIFVGEPVEHSSARYYLRSPLEVSTFLGMLLQLARRNLGQQ